MVTQDATTGKYKLTIDGLLRTEVSSFPKNCYEDHIYQCGTDTTNLVSATTYAACKAACAASSECAFFSFHSHHSTKRECRLCSADKANRKYLYRAFSGINPCPDAPVGKYTICKVTEQVGAVLTLSKNVGDCTLIPPSTGHPKPYSEDQTLFKTLNPAISFSTPPDVTATQSFPSVVSSQALTEILGSVNGNAESKRDTHRLPDRGTADIFIMRSPLPKCRPRGKAGVAFMGLPDKAKGQLVYYKHDPRLRTIDNTLESPADVKAGTRSIIAGSYTCPLVAPNFVNKNSCVRRQSGTCSPLKFKSGASLTLDKDTLRSWYTESGLFVYAMQGLRLEGAYKHSPCKADHSSRWLRAPNTVCKSPALDDQTAVTVSNAIKGGVCAPLELKPTDGTSMTALKWKLSMHYHKADNAGVARRCGAGDNWFGWSHGSQVGTASYPLVGAGTATLVFANCWTAGRVVVYHDGKEVGAAAVGETKTLVVPYTRSGKP